MLLLHFGSYLSQSKKKIVFSHSKQIEGRLLGFEAWGYVQGAEAVLTDKIENVNITKVLEFPKMFICA